VCQALTELVFITSSGEVKIRPGQMFEPANIEALKPLIDTEKIRIVPNPPPRSKPVQQTLYDYWVDSKGNLRKNILTYTGKSPDTVLYFKGVFEEMGAGGYLTGRALEDYQRETGHD
jgi:hypothetical protein